MIISVSCMIISRVISFIATIIYIVMNLVGLFRHSETTSKVIDTHMTCSKH